MFNETVDTIKSEDEQNFVDKHIVDKKDHPVAKDDQFVAKTSKKKRLADREDDKEVYEERQIECPDCGEMYAKGSEHECDLEEMSSDQMDKREKIVKSMKKKMGEFKKRYGDNAEKVMYATATKQAMKEDTDLTEDVIADLRKIVKKKAMSRVKLNDGSQPRIDLMTASAITQVYDALNSANKKKFADMLSKDETNLMKAVDFAFSKGRK